MKQATSYVTTTVRNDLLVYEHSHLVSFATVICFIYYTLLEASPRAHQPLLQLCHIQLTSYPCFPKHGQL